MLDHLAMGLAVAATPMNLLYCFFGCLYGTLVGVLPGFGPSAAIALLLPVTYGMSTQSAIIMLAGLYYGSAYGGSTTSILVNIPGEAASVTTCFDGYQMAKQGRAGSALGIAAIGSFIAGTLAIIGLSVIAPVVASLALRFGPPEFFSLMILGLTIVIYISFGSVLRAMIMGCLGIVLGCVGWDYVSGDTRITFGLEYLFDGIPIVPVLMGLFGISEVLFNLEKDQRLSVFKEVGNIWPSRKDFRESFGAILRGSGIGFFLGLLPGGGTVVSTFASYTVEKKISKHPERFGKGAIEGVAGPEAANNAAAQSGFVPLLTLGIPVSPAFALVFAALLVHGVHPGPMLMIKNPDVFWGVVTSMYIGNIFLLILNLPLIRIWVKVIAIPYGLLFPLILVFCLIGAFSDDKLGDVLVMIIFGIVGYLMKKFDYEPAPMVIAFVLSPILELNLRQSLILSGGSFSIFFAKPISLGCLIAVGLLVVSSVLPRLKNLRPKLGADE